MDFEELREPLFAVPLIRLEHNGEIRRHIVLARHHDALVDFVPEEIGGILQRQRRRVEGQIVRGGIRRCVDGLPVGKKFRLARLGLDVHFPQNLPQTDRQFVCRCAIRYVRQHLGNMKLFHIDELPAREIGGGRCCTWTWHYASTPVLKSMIFTKTCFSASSIDW